MNQKHKIILLLSSLFCGSSIIFLAFQDNNNHQKNDLSLKKEKSKEKTIIKNEDNHQENQSFPFFWIIFGIIIFLIIIGIVIYQYLFKNKDNNQDDIGNKNKDNIHQDNINPDHQKTKNPDPKKYETNVKNPLNNSNHNPELFLDGFSPFRRNIIINNCDLNSPVNQKDKNDQTIIFLFNDDSELEFYSSPFQ